MEKLNIIDYLQNSNYINQFSLALEMLNDFDDIIILNDTQNIGFCLSQYECMFKTYTVNDFDTLHNALTSDTYSTVTVNIKSNIKYTYFIMEYTIFYR